MLAQTAFFALLAFAEPEIQPLAAKEWDSSLERRLESRECPILTPYDGRDCYPYAVGQMCHWSQTTYPTRHKYWYCWDDRAWGYADNGQCGFPDGSGLIYQGYVWYGSGSCYWVCGAEKTSAWSTYNCGSARGIDGGERGAEWPTPNVSRAIEQPGGGEKRVTEMETAAREFQPEAREFQPPAREFQPEARTSSSASCPYFAPNIGSDCSYRLKGQTCKWKYSGYTEYLFCVNDPSDPYDPFWMQLTNGDCGYPDGSGTAEAGFVWYGSGACYWVCSAEKTSKWSTYNCGSARGVDGGVETPTDARAALDDVFYRRRAKEAEVLGRAEELGIKE